jgi:hypothetical protein
VEFASNSVAFRTGITHIRTFGIFEIRKSVQCS